MAALPLISICNPASSWYNFAYPLSWSNDCEVAEVLSDIPVVSVGVLMFGVSALLLVTRRVSISTIWLLFSTLQAFIAAVADVGQSLAIGTAMNSAFADNEPTVRAREILFAMSIGFRFLFYWTYVAEPPRKYASAMTTRTAPQFGLLIFERARQPHSGSWTRWGLPGRLLGVGLLLIIVAITALQIIWRVGTQFHQYSSVYATDVALELLVSFLLLLKLLLNTLTLNAPDDMTVHTFRECLAPVFALLVNIAIGVGNLLCFAFTESIVGRILQAIEVYILVLFVAVVSFLRHRDILLLSASSRNRKRRDLFTLPQPARGSTFRITLPVIETPRISMVLDSAVQNRESSREGFRRSARCSLNHVSSWVPSRMSRGRPPQEDEEVRLWDTEKVKMDPPYTSMSDSGTDMARTMSSTQKSKELADLLHDTPANRLSITSTLDSQSTIARSMESYSDQRSRQSQVNDVQRRTPSQVPSGANPMPVETPESSPVYGLSGIQRRPSQSQTASESRTSLDELFRQQNQLDKSIEVLKLFSARTSANSFHSDSTGSPRNVELSRSPSTGQRTISSEVSLSSFPIPPWLTTTVPPIPSPGPSSIRRIRGNRQARFAATPVDTHVSVPFINSAPPASIPSSPHSNNIPHSPFGEENESLPARSGSYSCSDSGATEYNVTSFIGGLVTPGETRQGSQEKSRWPSENECSADVIRATGSSGEPLSHRLPVPREAKGLPATPAAVKSQAYALDRSPSYVVDGPPEKVQYQSKDETSRILTNGTKSSLAIVPTCGSRQETEGLGAERAQRSFVRPRPPPLIIRTYTEQKTGVSQVQVLGDD